MLKPCPFCGSPAMIRDVDNYVDGKHMIAECTGAGCWARIEEYDLTEPVTLVTARWNRRDG